MMSGADGDQVLRLVLSALGTQLDLVKVEENRVVAPGNSTAMSVALQHRSPERRGNVLLGAGARMGVRRWRFAIGAHTRCVSRLQRPCRSDVPSPATQHRLQTMHRCGGATPPAPRETARTSLPILRSGVRGALRTGRAPSTANLLGACPQPALLSGAGFFPWRARAIQPLSRPRLLVVQRRRARRRALPDTAAAHHSAPRGVQRRRTV